VVNDRAVRERLSTRPDWIDGLHRQLVRLKDPFPSDIEIMVRWPDDIQVSSEAVPLVPRLARISTTPLSLGGVELHFENGQLMRFEDSKPVPLTDVELLPRMSLTIPYPVMPGVVAVTIFMPHDATSAEWSELVGHIWSQTRLVRDAQQRSWRETAIVETRERLAQARTELEGLHGPATDLREHIRLLEQRLTELESAPKSGRRVRTDLPFRELAWLRAFLGTDTTPYRIAGEWDRQIDTWHREGGARRSKDLILSAAYDEWHATSGGDPSPITAPATVERGLKRWLGESLTSPLGNPRTT
jgi:hypothetical protein